MADDQKLKRAVVAAPNAVPAPQPRPASPAVAGPFSAFAANMGANPNAARLVVQPATVNSPTAPQMAVAAPSAGPMPANLAAPPVLPPPQLESGGERLWQRANKIKNPWLRGLADVGTGIARAGDVALESVDPRMAALIPGSEVNTNLRNAENQRNFVNRTALNLKNEEVAQQPLLEQERETNAADLGKQREQSAAGLEQQREAAATERQKEAETSAQKLTDEREKMAEKLQSSKPLNDAFHQYLADPSDYANFLKLQQQAKKEFGGAYGSFGPAFLAYHLMNQAYQENPALLPVLAPMLSKMFEASGTPLSANAQSVLASAPVGQPLSPETGQPIGLRQPGAPTGATRSRSQFALSGVLEELPRVKQEIANLSGQLGPIQGRWNEFSAGKVGANNPQFNALRTSLTNIATAWMRLHANSEKAREDFENVLARSKTADDLVANLDAIGQQAQNYYNQELGYGEKGATKAAKKAKGPKVGTIRVIDGQKAKWDGKGWLAVTR